jgi:glutaconate CoA-transferase subunit A
MAKSPRFVSVAELAASVQDGDRLGVGGLHFSRLPIALLKEVIAQGRKDLRYITWGGGLPLEMLLGANAIQKIVFCFSSLDIFGLAPMFRQALETKRVEVEEWNALGMIQGFHAAEENLPSMPFQVPRGSTMLDGQSFVARLSDPLTGREVMTASALPLDVVLLHAQRADEAGNVEIQGALGLDRSVVGAAQQVLVTVEEIVPAGTFQKDRRGKIIGHTFITAIASSPGGAYPASCIPYYITDYRAVLEGSQSVPFAVQPATDIRFEFVQQAAQVSVEQLTPPVLLKQRGAIDLQAPPTAAEQMIVSLARHYDNESVCAAGAVSPLAIISYFLAKKMHAPNLVTMMISSGLVDPAARPMLLLMAESVDFETSVFHCGGDDTYHWYYQRGLVSHEVVSAAQIDKYGRANNIQLTTPSGKIVRLPGQGGMADVANLHQNFLMYITRHSPLTLVEEAQIASAARGLITDEERQAEGLRPGYTRIVTNLGIFELNKESGLLELMSLHPGISDEQIIQETGFAIIKAANFHESPPPTAEELAFIRTEIDPLDIRRLEFISSRERASLIDEILTHEEAALKELIAH